MQFEKLFVHFIKILEHQSHILPPFSTLTELFHIHMISWVVRSCIRGNSYENVRNCILDWHNVMPVSWSYPWSLVNFCERKIHLPLSFFPVKISLPILVPILVLISVPIMVPIWQSYFIKLFDTGLQCEFILSFFVRILAALLARSSTYSWNSSPFVHFKVNNDQLN